MRNDLGIAPAISSRPAKTGRLPSVSVLLPAWNEGRMLARCLDSVLAIDWPDLEVVVCAGGTDGTLDIARRYEGSRVTVLKQQAGEGKQRALRRCFERSRGEIVYLTDADCIVGSASFRAVIEPIVEGEAAAATGTSRPLPEQQRRLLPFFRWSIQRGVERRRSPESTGLLGRNCAVSREALIAAGAFAEPAFSRWLGEPIALRCRRVRGAGPYWHRLSPRQAASRVK